MYVYIWKDNSGVPFYVGLTKRIGRTNPKNNGGRNWLTKQKLASIGEGNVVVEFHIVPTVEEGQDLERKLIKEYGRIQTNDGTLTNLRAGGEGMTTASPERIEALRIAMRDPNHPIRSPEARARQRTRMQDPEVRALFAGLKNPAKKPEVRAKLKEIWTNNEYRDAQIKARTGIKHNLSEETRSELAIRIKENPAMKTWSERNGKDESFDAKRIAGIKAAQPKRAEKMRDPVALAQRKERLKVTMSSPEYKAKRAKFDTPEYRQKLSEAKKRYWAEKKLQFT